MNHFEKELAAVTAVLSWLKMKPQQLNIIYGDATIHVTTSTEIDFNRAVDLIEQHTGIDDPILHPNGYFDFEFIEGEVAVCVTLKYV